jgi:multidrug resistance efflux pump
MIDVVTGLMQAHDVLGDAKDALRECQATIETLQRQLATAQMMERYWEQQHGEAWIQIGRIDYALEQIVSAQGIRDARHWARKMREEIKAHTTTKKRRAS